eukprot:3036328-Heterocapsa_arctica.AAC.1
MGDNGPGSDSPIEPPGHQFREGLMGDSSATTTEVYVCWRRAAQPHLQLLTPTIFTTTLRRALPHGQLGE